MLSLASNPVILERATKLVANNPAQFVLVDYRDQPRLYLWAFQPVDFNAGEYGVFSVPPLTWVEVKFPQGTRLIPINVLQSFFPMDVILRATTLLYLQVPPPPLSIIDLQGQALGLFTAVDVRYYKTATIGFDGIWSGSFNLTGAIDGTRQYALGFYNANAPTTVITSVTANGLYIVPLGFRYFSFAEFNVTGNPILSMQFTP